MLNERACLEVLSALAHETRLRIVRLLVAAGAPGIAAGEIATAVGVSPSNVSFHLKELERAGLVTTRREQRSIYYVTSVDVLAGLLQFLMQDCCGGRPEICTPAFAQPTCSPRIDGESRD